MKRTVARGTAAVGVLLALLVGSIGVSPSSSGADDTGTEAVTDVVTLLPLKTEGTRIVDSEGRDVIMRGANVNSLGEYWQGVPGVDPTIPITDADWESMAEHGMSVVRLLITWSRVEPTRGTFDQAYLDQVDAAVTAAKAHGIYTVIDMHQDAYTAFLFTAQASDCPAGTTPAKGWDGAPAWAVLSDGLSTCLTGADRNSSPAVNRAWNNFYDNVDGIRDEFVLAWKAVASRFKGRPEVAGYDLLNEPEVPRPAGEFGPVYNDFLRVTITGIREAEAGAPFAHLLMVEPALPAGDPSRGLVVPNVADVGISKDNVVASPHNYAESISVPGLDLNIEGINSVTQSYIDGAQVGAWGGEYGFWNTEPETLAVARRYAADEDKHMWGGAWWQWRQSCGDPHGVQWDNGTVVVGQGDSTHLNTLHCPGNVDAGPTEPFLNILGRAYPRATPGRILELRSDIDTGHLKVKAHADIAGGELVVWSPSADDADHPINVSGLTDVKSHAVPGGRLITATVVGPGDYTLWIGPADQEPTETTVPPTMPPATDPTTAPSTDTVPPASDTAPYNSTSYSPSSVTYSSTPATAVEATPTYTG